MHKRLPLLIAFGAGIAVAVLFLRGDWRAWLLPEAAQATAALYAERDWRQGEPSKLNISLFTFADRNRNGRYDLGDRPLAGIAARLTRPDGSAKIVRSNVNGYANFSMQRGGSDADIDRAGASYRFEALPPPSWLITTDNARQTTTFMEVPGSITGLGARQPPAVVGLAPPLTVSGRWPSQRNGSLAVASADGSARHSVTLDGAGNFSTALAPGDWTIADTVGVRRSVRLAYAPVVLAAPPAAAGTSVAEALATVTVDFDDNTRSFIEKLPGGYAGLDWDYLLAVDNQFYKGPGYVNGNISGAMIAYNSSGHPVTVRGRRPGERFDFVGGYFAAAWHNAEGETLIVRAYRDDAVLAEERVELSHLTPVYLLAEYTAITRLELSTEHYWQFVADDLAFRVRADAPAGRP